MDFKLNRFFTIVFLFTFISCGKDLGETNNSDEVVSRRALNSNGENSIFLNSQLFPDGTTQSEIYSFKDNALITIPAFIEVSQGNAQDKWARIYMNINEDGFEYFCDYLDNKNNDSYTDEPSTQKYYFTSCYQDIDGNGSFEELNYYPGYESIQERFHKIKLELLGRKPQATMSAKVLFEIKWH